MLGAPAQAPKLSHPAVVAGKFETKYKHRKRYDASRANYIFPKSLNCVLSRDSYPLVNALMLDEMGCYLLF